MKAAEARDVALIDSPPPSPADQAGWRPAAPGPRASARAITLNFITGGLGSAIFSLPWSVAGSSVLTSVAIVAFVLALNAWTISIVVRAGDRYNAFDLGGVLAKFPHGLGPLLQAVTNVFVWISLFLALVSYIIVIHDSAKTLVSGTLLDSRLLLVGSASLLVLPLCFFSQRLLEKTSGLCIAVNVYLAGLVVALYLSGASNGTLPEGCCLFGATVRGNFATLNVMFMAVIVQMCVLPMYKELEDRSPRKFDRIVAVGFTVLFLIFCGFSCIGYLLIGPGVKSNILESLPKGPASTVAQVGTIFAIASVYPIMLRPMVAPIQDSEGKFLGLDRRVAAAAVTCLIVAAAMGTALFVNSLGFVNVVNGAMSAMIFIALLPSFIGLTMMDFGRAHKVALVFLLVGGILVSSLGFVFNENYVADLQCSIAA